MAAKKKSDPNIGELFVAMMGKIEAIGSRLDALEKRIDGRTEVDTAPVVPPMAKTAAHSLMSRRESAAMGRR